MALPASPPALFREYYETPAAFTRACAADLQTRVPDLFRPPEFDPATDRRVLPWCAPAVGRGAILEAWPQPAIELWETNDLDPQWPARFHANAADPATWQRFRPARTVIENPPFTVAAAILQRALEYADEAVVLHLRLSFFEPTKRDPRAELLRQWPRFGFRRSPTTGEWTTDSVATVWATWLQAPLYDHVEPWIAFASPATVAELAAETPDYRRRMDQITGSIPTEA
jgi:hypothetical protein